MKTNDHMDELRKRFPKHLYDSNEEESDYEITDKDEHARIPKMKWSYSIN